jgi:hypothetical protein
MVSNMITEFFARPPRALALGAALLALVALLAALLPSGPLALDRWCADAIGGSPSGLLHRLALVCDFLGRDGARYALR